MMFTVAIFRSELGGKEVPQIPYCRSVVYDYGDHDIYKKFSDDKVEVILSDAYRAEFPAWPKISLKVVLNHPTKEYVFNLATRKCGRRDIYFNVYDTVGRCVAQEGVWEQHVNNAIRGLLRIAPEGIIAIDIGAHVGIHTLAMSEFAPVHSFEPINYNRCILTMNIDNQPANHPICVHSEALSDRIGGVCMNYNLLTPYGGGNCNMGDIHIGSGTYHVNTTTLDDVFVGKSATSQSIVPGHVEEVLDSTDECVGGDILTTSTDAAKTLDPVWLIKMDAQGAEPAILAGASRLIERDRPYIICEFEQHQLQHHGRNLSDLYQAFRQLKYNLHFLASGYPSDYIAVPQSRTSEFVTAFGSGISTLDVENPISQPIANSVVTKIVFPST